MKNIIQSHAYSIVVSRLALGNDLHDRNTCQWCSKQTDDTKAKLQREINRIEAQEMHKATISTQFICEKSLQKMVQAS